MYETKIHVIDNLWKFLMQTCFDFDQDIINAATDQWRDPLRSCVRAGGGHFEHMLWHEWSFIWFNRTFYETVNVIWCM